MGFPGRQAGQQGKKQGKGLDRDALWGQKALEKQFTRAQSQAAAVGQKAPRGASPDAPTRHSYPISDRECEGQDLSPDTSLATAGSPRPSLADHADLFDCQLEVEEEMAPMGGPSPPATPGSNYHHTPSLKKIRDQSFL